LGIFEIMVKVLTACGLHDFRVRVGTRDESDKYIGSPEIWEKALSNITGALKEKKIPFSVEEGEAAFYGPKADTIVKDALGREWQLGTVQVDYNLPERFDLSYIGEDDKPHRPIMIHRAPFGSLERFTAILIEHFKGAFPPWLAPNAVRVLPLSDKFNDYAFSIREQLSKQGIASQVDDSNNTLSYKIRQAQLEKAPIVVVVGEREQKEKTVTIRLRNGKQFPNHKIDSFIQKTVEIVRERKLEYSY
jgi:threonyl-tRNA synthetase